MAFSFALDERPRQGVRRLASAQVSKVLKLLKAGSGSATSIHESRKALKRLKTLFKLVRTGLSKPIYEREYDVIRESSRALSGTRDMDVMPATLAVLSSADPSISDEMLAPIRNALARAREDHEQQAAAVSEVIASLEAARTRYKKLELDCDEFAMLAAGAAKCLRKLQRQHCVAVASSEDEDYHNWRKGAQLHWRQLRLLSEAWPEMIAARISIAQELAVLLGDDHDLSVLAAFIEDLPRAQIKNADKKAVLSAARARQQALREKAHAYTGFLVTDDPDNFAEGLSACHAARVDLAAMSGPAAASPAAIDRDVAS